MTQKKYVLAIEVGTTQVSAVAMMIDGSVALRTEAPVATVRPQSNWVEQDATEIWQATQRSLSDLFAGDIAPEEVAAIGVTNQRETMLVWDKETGLPIHNAVSWQSRQSAAIVNQLVQMGHEDLFRERTGLRLDPYFSATKLRWILDSVPGAQVRAETGELLAGTLDTWITWQLTRGAVFATDVTNASRTLMMNIKTCEWDETLLALLDIPRIMLPTIVDNATVVGETSPRRFFGVSVPIAALVGDQQAAAFGSLSLQPGTVTGTYGTGAFLLMNTGQDVVQTSEHLLTTVAYSVGGEVTYALEGTVMIAGAAVAWLRDSMQLLRSATASSAAAQASHSDDDIYVVPAFNGLGSPYFDDRIRGSVFGITLSTTKNDFVKAVLQGIAYQSRDVLDLMQRVTGLAMPSLRVGGSAAQNDYLMQFQSDITRLAVLRTADVDTTARGAAYLAGLTVGFWPDVESLRQLTQNSDGFIPAMDGERRDRLYSGWQDAVEATQFFGHKRR